MPPRKSISKKRASSNRLTEQNVPIYEILSNKQIREPMMDLLPHMEKCLKENPGDLKLSFLNMLIRVCGLDEYSSGIESENTIDVLEEILQKAYENKKTETIPLILETKNKFHKDFVKRLREFLSTVISEQLSIFSDQTVQFNQSFLSWLDILTKSKLRVIRNASVHFAKLLVEEEIKLYEQYYEKKQSKKAFNISKTIGYFLEKIFSQRLKDVDQSIRELSFGITTIILEQLQGDLMTDSLLNKIFSPLLQEDPIVMELTVKSLHALFQKCKGNKNLKSYIKDQLPKFTEISRSPHLTMTNVTALKTISILHHQQPTLKILNKNFFISVFESYAPLSLFYGLHAVAQVFYESLYKTTQQLEANSSIVLLEVINLLMGVGSQKSLNMILKTFFCSNKKIQSVKVFNIDNMFTLLLSQFYRDENNQDIRLKDKEISLLLTIISQWIAHCAQSFKHEIKEKQIYEKILQSFNNHILMNCKQLFFEKMTEHQQLASKYLNIFTQIHTPTLNFSGLENYLDFVSQKIDKLFCEDIEDKDIYKEITNVLHNLSKDEKLAEKYSAKSLINRMGLLKLTAEGQQITPSQIYRLSGLMTKFQIEQLLTSNNFMSNLIEFFAHSQIQKQRMQSLIIFHFIHHQNFMQLLHNPSETQQSIYKNVRSKVLRLYLEILDNQNQKSSIKLCGFRGLTYMLRTISSRKFQEVHGARVNAYELTSQQMKVIYDYVTRQLFHSDTLDYSSLDVTRMLEKMSLESHQIKSEVIRLLFGLYEESYVFACHSESARFLISLIRAQHQLHRESLNRSNLLPLSLDLSRDVQRQLNSLLNNYLLEEIKQSNFNKLIYWRLCYEIFAQAREDERFQVIMDKLLTFYFSKKRLDPDQKKRQINKPMIFILHAVDKILERKEYIQLDIYENILRKVYRKFQKQVLIRIKEFFIQKTQGIQSNFVNTFLETLQSISKVQVKKSKMKEEQEDDGSHHQQQTQNDRQTQNQQSGEQENRNKKSSRKTSRKSRAKPKAITQQNRRMEIEEVQEEENPVVEHHRNTRSQTKRKIK